VPQPDRSAEPKARTVNVFNVFMTWFTRLPAPSFIPPCLHQRYIVLPFLIAYTAYAHRVFGGKVREPLY